MNQSQTPQHNPKINGNNHRPENKDNLDCGKNEAFDYKGNDITHNKKEHHGETTKTKDQKAK